MASFLEQSTSLSTNRIGYDNMTKTKTRALNLDEDYIAGRPLRDLMRSSKSIEYRDRNGEKFTYPAAELIAAGYTTVPESLLVEAVYVLYPKKR